jgi:hypothetical protein
MRFRKSLIFMQNKSMGLIDGAENSGRVIPPVAKTSMEVLAIDGPGFGTGRVLDSGQFTQTGPGFGTGEGRNSAKRTIKDPHADNEVRPQCPAWGTKSTQKRRVKSPTATMRCGLTVRPDNEMGYQCPELVLAGNGHARAAHLGFPVRQLGP